MEHSSDKKLRQHISQVHSLAYDTFDAPAYTMLIDKLLNEPERTRFKEFERMKVLHY
jgi:hypothetical protein